MAMDLSKFATLQVFTLETAAKLWCEAETITPESRVCIQAWFDQLVTAASRGELPVDKAQQLASRNMLTGEVRYRTDWNRSKVTRTNLKVWSEKNGHRPRFLFPVSDDVDEPKDEEAPLLLPQKQSPSFPGRPSIMAAVEQEMRRRASAGELLPSLRQESAYLSEWARLNHHGQQTPTAKTIENALRNLYRELHTLP